MSCLDLGPLCVAKAFGETVMIRKAFALLLGVASNLRKESKISRAV